ncbi:MAG TPA: TCP-1/cpn60 chaperonin family protein, partial [Planctomycetota bacterium]|nr:TCP-1/cpn60 chaperonin family protein [Planctomycetota bacterium]
LHATRAAVEEGIVAGGGVALLRTKKVIEELAKTLDHDQRLGAEIVLRAVEAPAKQIAANAGQNGAVIVAEILSNKSASYGYNARTSEYENLVKAGVVDPAKVTRVALQNAASIAGLMLTVEAIITDLKDEDAPIAGAVIVAEILSNKSASYGYNARTGEYEDLVKAGVVDPAKVTRVALQNAASIAGLMLTVEAMITDLKDEDAPIAGAVS